MADQNLEASWQRTISFLRDARSAFPEGAEQESDDELQAFEDYLDHNELELALDMLDAAYEKSGKRAPGILKHPFREVPLI